MEDFLREPNNSHAREKLFNHYLWFELEKAAVEANYELQIYRPDTDHVGVDVLLDDQRIIKGFQIKTVLDNAKTTTWNIHNRLLKPSPEHYHDFRIDNGSTIGLEGGVILINIGIRNNSDLEISIEYFDIYILKMYLNKIMKRKKCNTFDMACKIYDAISRKTDEFIKIPRSMFVKPKNFSALLALSGMRSSCSSVYRYKVLKSSINANVNNSDKKILQSFLQDLIEDQGIVYL